jgi:predicted GNAT superfamily acetyltransferase
VQRAGATTTAGPGEVEIRQVVDPPDLAAAAAVINAVWEDPALSSPSLLRAYTFFGNPTFAALVDSQLVGVCVGFLAPSGGTHLHSHITGVLPEFQHLGLGYRLKLAQRAWCRQHGIPEVTWTFDPMLARNAHFNLRKLGAVAEAILPEFYGEMHDAVNHGDVTDRLEMHWHVEPATPAGPARGGDPARTVAIPADYLSLRRSDPAAARRERLRVREELAEAFAAGLVIVDYSERFGYEFTERR